MGGCHWFPGSRTLKWVYSEGGSAEDNAWVDFVQWTGPSPAQDPSNWQAIDYKHDVYGRRIEKKVDGYGTRYLYDGPHVIAEYDGNNNLLRKYIYGPGIDQPVCMIEVADSNAVYYYHYDALGSVVALSDSAGDTVQTYEYSVYGQVAVEDINHPNPYMFTGRRFDIEIGLYYNRARYYNPYTGRFLQTDPIGYQAGMNLYKYCGHNSLNYTDPSGLDPVTEEEFENLKLIAGSLAELARSGYISDVEGLAGTVDAIIVYSGSEPNDVGDFMSAFTRLLSAWLWAPQWYDTFHTAVNKEYITRFGDNGFKEKYQEPRGPGFDPNQMGGRNQVTHFVGYVAAGYHGSVLVADCFCYYREIRVQGQTTDSADYLLGLVAIDVGAALMRYSQSDSSFKHIAPCPICGQFSCEGLPLSELSDWIRNNLGE